MDIAQEYAHWYHKTYIKLELVKLAKSKEMAMLPYTDEHNKAIEIGTLKKGIAVRNINGYCLDYLHQNFEAYDFYNRAVKLYCSLATFKDKALPLFSFSPSTREEQQKEFVDKIMAKPLDYIDGYDFAIDIDEKSWDKGKAYAKKIKDIFDPADVLNSGKLY